MAKFVDVSDMDDRYSRARTDDFDSVPDDEYRAIIIKAEFKWFGQSSQERIYEWNFEIMSGEFQGAVLQKLNFLRTDDQFKWLKIDMSKCGVKHHTLSQIQQHQQDLIGMEVAIKTQTKDGKNGPRQYVYIVNRVEKAQQSAAPSGPPPVEDDIPF